MSNMPLDTGIAWTLVRASFPHGKHRSTDTDCSRTIKKTSCMLHPPYHVNPTMSIELKPEMQCNEGSYGLVVLRLQKIALTPTSFSMVQFYRTGTKGSFLLMILSGSPHSETDCKCRRRLLVFSAPDKNASSGCTTNLKLVGGPAETLPS